MNTQLLLSFEQMLLSWCSENWDLQTVNVQPEDVDPCAYSMHKTAPAKETMQITRLTVINARLYNNNFVTIDSTSWKLLVHNTYTSMRQWSQILILFSMCSFWCLPQSGPLTQNIAALSLYKQKAANCDPKVNYFR